jgi:hypothetical protein
VFTSVIAGLNSNNFNALVDLYAIRLTVFQVGLDVGTEEITEVVPTISACVVFLFDKPIYDTCDTWRASKLFQLF